MVADCEHVDVVLVFIGSRAAVDILDLEVDVALADRGRDAEEKKNSCEEELSEAEGLVGEASEKKAKLVSLGTGIKVERPTMKSS